jgi:hypothetical protein
MALRLTSIGLTSAERWLNAAINRGQQKRAL